MTDLLQPDAVEVARPVLRGEGISDAPLLPDWGITGSLAK